MMQSLREIPLPSVLARGIGHADEEVWQRIWQGVTAGENAFGERFALYEDQEDQAGTVYVQGISEFGEVDTRPAIPLEHAMWLADTVLIDRRTLPESYAHAGIFCKTALKNRGGPTLFEMADGLSRACIEPDTVVPVPVYPEVVEQARRAMIEARARARHVFDRDVLATMRTMVEVIDRHLPQVAEAEQHERDTSHGKRVQEPVGPRYYWILYAVRKARAMLSYFEAPVVYTICTRSSDTSVGDTYALVGTNRERAERRVADLYVSNRDYAPMSYAYELYENDMLIIRYERTERYLEAYELSVERKEDRDRLPWE